MIPYGHQFIDDEDIQAVLSVLKSDWLTQGPMVDEFEKKLASYCGAEHAVVFSNGTAALMGAYFAIGIKKDDEVISTPLTFAATTNAALWHGARPVFADVQEDTGNIDPALIEALITDKTKAIVPVDYAGHPVEIDEIMRIAKKHNLLVIEDAAHAIGASIGDRKIGSIADVTISSFHPVKAMTTGEGGVAFTNR